MNNIKKIIKNPLVVLVIAALVGGFFGSYFTYRLNNLSTEKRNKEATKQVMLFIHNEIYENYVYKSQSYYGLFGVEGLDLMNLREGDLTIKHEQLACLLKMYGHFRIYNFKRNEWDEATNLGLATWYTDILPKGVRNWEDICMQDIEGYEEEFCKDKSLKSEIEIE